MSSEARPELVRGLVPWESAAFKADPYPWYRRLLADGPVIRDDGILSWLVTSHELCGEVLADYERFTPNQKAWEHYTERPFPVPKGVMEANLFSAGREDHSRMRRHVSRGFTPRAVERMRRLTREVVSDLIEKARPQGQMELVTEFAQRVPLEVMSDILGIPERLKEPFREFAHAVVRIGVNPMPSPELIAEIEPPMHRGMQLLLDLIDERRSAGSARGDDLLDVLVAASEDGDRMSHDEMVGMVMTLVIAGIDTTVNAITISTRRLLAEPELRASLAADPSLWPAAVRELLRAEWIGGFMPRYALHDLELAGTRIHAGAMVMACIGPANVDPAVFRDPEKLDLGRDNGQMMTFGRGAHYCVGANLAQLELHEALEAIFSLPGLRADGEAVFSNDSMTRRIDAQPLSWDIA
jgi:cytochrome P450